MSAATASRITVRLTPKVLIRSRSGGSRRPTDSSLVEMVTLSSLAFGSIDAGGALLPLAELVDEVDESWARILGSVLVLLVGTTVLAPLLRRLQSAPTPTNVPSR